MTSIAAPAAVERPVRRGLLVWALLAFEAAVLFACAGAAARTLGPWTPDPGALLLVALAVRGDARPLWAGALCVSAGRLAVGVDPPAAVLAGYYGAASLHASLCALVDPDRPLVRSACAALYAAALSAWLVAAHELAAPVPLGLAARAPGEALAAGLATGALALALVPALRLLPGVVAGPRRARRAA